MAAIMIIAGESSGDLHASRLAAAIKSQDPKVKIFGLGGSQSAQAGVEILADPTQLAVIGVAEVLKKLPAFKRLFQLAVQALDERHPALVILVDYPGFNLRFAQEVKRRRIRLVYYISPQIWAWDPGRIKLIKKLVDRMLVILPFEKPLYEKAGVPVTFVGHPLLEVVHPTYNRLEILQKLGLEDGLPVIGLLPGSREGEIRRILPTLLESADRLQSQLPSTARFILIKAPHLPWEIYREALAKSRVQPKVIERWDYDSIYACDLVLVASGTATLECALLERPMLIIYKTSWPTYLLSRLLIRIPYIGLINVVAGQKVAPEFIQAGANSTAIAKGALELWRSTERRQEMKEAFQKIRRSLGEPGAAQKAAQAVLQELRQTEPAVERTPSIER